jgi:DNA-binding GntR family transcriptional regulator
VLKSKMLERSFRCARLNITGAIHMNQDDNHSVLLKQTVAARLREEILNGGLPAGERIVEGKWATKLGVAQGSVREALNLLAADGLVSKGAGRSARVISLSRQDVQHIYDVRIGLESQSARLLAEKRADMTELFQIVATMEAAAHSGDIPGLIEQDLLFHLALARDTGNSLLFEHTRRLLTPLFAFVLLRAKSFGPGLDPWAPTLPDHRRILDVIKFGDPAVAEQYVARATRGFAVNAQAYWAGPATGDRQAPSSG